MAVKELISPTKEASLNERIEVIVECNLRSGRFQRVCNFRCRVLAHEEYTVLVRGYYIQHSPMVLHLEQGDLEAWEQLSHRLFRVAYTLLLNRNWNAEQAYVRAQEAMQEACLSIYCRVYPYDCPFDAWVFTILHHHVFRSYHRSRNPLDFPDVTHPLDELPEKAAEPTEFTDIERHEPFLCALKQLHSPAQRQVIDCLFFQGLSPEETAQKLGKTIQAVYNLKGRALANLSSLLTGEEWE
jgi:RNA polymerase sigma factor (sigma-70 family)